MTFETKSISVNRFPRDQGLNQSRIIDAKVWNLKKDMIMPIGPKGPASV